MKRHYARMLCAATMLACAGDPRSRASSPGGDIQQLEQTLLDASAAGRLRQGVQEILRAHQQCNFPSAVQLILKNPPASWPEITAVPKNYCLTGVELVTVDLAADGSTANIIIKAMNPGSQFKEDFFILAVLAGREWHFSWPIGMGPEKLH
jgi:hypothetical protein